MSFSVRRAATTTISLALTGSAGHEQVWPRPLVVHLAASCQVGSSPQIEMVSVTNLLRCSQQPL